MSGSESAAQAQALQPVQPNLFTLAGGGLHITFSTTGIDGRPHLTYQDPQRALSFIGDQISIDEVPDLGQVVSVTLVLTPDSGSTTFSLLVPRVQLAGPGGISSVPVSTDGITVHHRFSLVPALNHGQQDLYTVTPLRGAASHVMFIRPL
jgi:hypothetical protein